MLTSELICSLYLRYLHQTGCMIQAKIDVNFNVVTEFICLNKNEDFVQISLVITMIAIT